MGAVKESARNRALKDERSLRLKPANVLGGHWDEYVPAPPSGELGRDGGTAMFGGEAFCILLFDALKEHAALAALERWDEAQGFQNLKLAHDFP